MTLQRLVLILAVLSFAGPGVVFLLAPGAALDFLGDAPDPSPAMVEIRATFGGLQLGFAAFFAWCSLRPERYQIGLTAVAVSVYGLAAGRVVGLAVDRMVDLVMVSFLVFELIGATAAVVALRTSSRGPAAAA